MTKEISPESEQFIQTVIENGEFQSRAQVLDEALKLLKTRQQLRRDVDAGIEQLERGEGIDGEEVFERFRRKTE